MIIEGVNYPSDSEAKESMVEIGRRIYEKIARAPYTETLKEIFKKEKIKIEFK